MLDQDYRGGTRRAPQPFEDSVILKKNLTIVGIGIWCGRTTGTCYGYLSRVNEKSINQSPKAHLDAH